MIFLIDVDGVVANLLTKLLDTLKKSFNRSKVPTYDEFIDWNWCNAFSTDQYQEVEKILNAPGFSSDLSTIKGAKEGVTKIRNAGHIIYWVTSPWLTSRTWEADRREWLKNVFNVDPHNIIQTHAKHLITGDILIDDKIENIKQWSKAQGKAGLLYTQPWNQKVKDLNRFTWREIDKLLETV